MEGFMGYHLPTDSDARKDAPICSGVLDYFPDAIAEIAKLSKIGNDKHNPGQPLHWSRHKSSDHADCIMRHMLDRGTVDTDGLLHDVKVAWRALAMLQLALEAQRADAVPASDAGDPFPIDLHREPPGKFFDTMHTMYPSDREYS